MARPPGYTGFLVFLANTRAMRSMSNRSRVAIVLFAFPVLLLGAAMLYGLEAGSYILRSERVEGTVVERYDWPGETIFDRGSINYELVFTYEMGGETRRASVGSGHSSFNLEPGETAMIRVLPGGRGNVRLDTWQGLWFMPVMLGVFGLAALVIAGFLWLILTRLFFRKDTS